MFLSSFSLCVSECTSVQKSLDLRVRLHFRRKSETGAEIFCPSGQNSEFSTPCSYLYKQSVNKTECTIEVCHEISSGVSNSFRNSGCRLVQLYCVQSIWNERFLTSNQHKHKNVSAARLKGKTGPLDSTRAWMAAWPGRWYSGLVLTGKRNPISDSAGGELIRILWSSPRVLCAWWCWDVCTNSSDSCAAERPCCTGTLLKCDGIPGSNVTASSTFHTQIFSGDHKGRTYLEKFLGRQACLGKKGNTQEKQPPTWNNEKGHQFDQRSFVLRALALTRKRQQNNRLVNSKDRAPGDANLLCSSNRFTTGEMAFEEYFPCNPPQRWQLHDSSQLFVLSGLKSLNNLRTTYTATPKNSCLAVETTTSAILNTS